LANRPPCSVAERTNARVRCSGRDMRASNHRAPPAQARGPSPRRLGTRWRLPAERKSLRARPRRGPVGIAGSAGGDGDGEGVDQAGSDPQEGRSLPDRFAHPAEAAPDEVPQTAVDDPKAVGRSGPAELPALDQGHVESPPWRVPGQTGARDAASDHQRIVPGRSQRPHFRPHRDGPAASAAGHTRSRTRYARRCGARRCTMISPTSPRPMSWTPRARQSTASSSRGRLAMACP
jgi:hypothetical protein